MKIRTSTSIKEAFEIVSDPLGTNVTRTTIIVATSPFRRIKELGFYLGLKRVHFFVFKNWRTKAEQKDGGITAVLPASY